MNESRQNLKTSQKPSRGVRDFSVAEGVPGFTEKTEEMPRFGNNCKGEFICVPKFSEKTKKLNKVKCLKK